MALALTSVENCYLLTVPWTHPFSCKAYESLIISIIKFAYSIEIEAWLLISLTCEIRKKKSLCRLGLKNIFSFQNSLLHIGQLTYLKQMQMYPFPHHLSFKKVVQGYLFILISDIYLLFILFLLLFLLLLFLLILLL